MLRRMCLAVILLLLISSTAPALAVGDELEMPTVASLWAGFLDWLSSFDKSTSEGGSSPDPDGLSRNGEGGSSPDPNGLAPGPLLPTTETGGSTDVGAQSDPDG